MKKKFAIGDTFTYKGKRYKISKDIERNYCIGCTFCGKDCSEIVVGENFPNCQELESIYIECEENEPLDMTKILDGCPEGTEFYSTVFGEVKFVDMSNRMIYFTCKNGCAMVVYKDGSYFNNYKGGCTVFPSKDQRDWSKFERFWDKPKKERFDPKTLQPFDKVMVRDENGSAWRCSCFSHITGNKAFCPGAWKQCIPYNDETKHLVGTNDEAPEYYRYWED